MPEAGGSSTATGVGYEQWVYAELMMQTLISDSCISTTAQKIREDSLEKNAIKRIIIDDLVIQEENLVIHYNIKHVSPSGVWKVSELISQQILDSFKKQYESTPERKMYLVTQSDSPFLRELDRIKRFKSRIEIEDALSSSLLNEWDKFINYLEYSDEKALEFIQSIGLKQKIENQIKTHISDALQSQFNSSAHIGFALFSFAFEQAKFKKESTKTIILNYLKEKGFFPKSKVSVNEIIESFNKGSILMSKEQNIGGHKIIEREKINEISDWIKSDIENDSQKICVITGDAGTGKTNFLTQVYNRLKKGNIPALALKADQIDFKSLIELKKKNNFSDSIDMLFSKLSDEFDVSVLIIDQLDALSLSLSKDRKQLARYTELLLLISRIQKVKIIVSCRKFDLYSDINLSHLRNYKTFEVGKFTNNEVDEILLEKGIEPSSISDDTKIVLKTPLYLSIFILVTDEQKSSYDALPEISSIHDLYEKLWNLLLEKAEARKDQLQELIYSISQEIYDRQSLQIGEHLFKDNYLDELTLLKSFGIVQSQRKKISFFHQTFFDYTLARLFVSKQKHISNYLIENTIQGLYQRSRIKAILDYLWYSDEDFFIEECDTILFGKKFKIHIKHLVLNILGNISTENKEVEHLVKRVLDETSLGIAFSNGIINLNWVNFITTKYELNYDSKHISKIVTRICQRFKESEPNTIIDFIDKYQKHLDKGQVVWCLTKCPKTYNKTFIRLFDKYKTTFYEQPYALSIVLKKGTSSGDLSFVSNVLIEQVKFNKENNKEYLDYHFKELIEAFAEKDLYRGTDLVISVLNLICLQNLIEHPKYEYLKIDRAFLEYYGEKENDNHSFLYDLCIDLILKINDTELIQSKLSELINSNYEICTKIALEVISKDPEKLCNSGLDLLKGKVILKEFNNGDNHYQYVVGKMIKEIFPFLKETDQLDTFELIMKTPEASVKLYKNYSKYYMKETLESRYHLLTVLPSWFIQRDIQRYKQFQEFVRRFGLFEWEKPKGIGVSISSGNVPLPEEAYKSMSLEALKDSFRKVEIGSARFRNRFTAYGHSERFCSLVNENPQKYYSLLEDLVSNPHENNVKPIYIVNGIKGLIKSEEEYQLDKTKLFHLVIDNFEFYERSYAYEIVQMATLLFSETHDPKTLQFIQKLTLSQSLNITGTYFWTTLIEFYIKIAKIDKYRELCFETLEKIIETNTNELKLALLGKIAWFIEYDRKRSYQIFIDALNNCKHNDLFDRLRESIQYMLRIEVESAVPFLTKLIEELEDKSVQNWYGQLLCSIKLENLYKVDNLLYKAEKTSSSYKSGILEFCVEKLKSKPLMQNSFEHEKLIEYLASTEDEFYGIYNRLIDNTKNEYFLNYFDFLVAFINSKVRNQEYHDLALYKKLHEMASIHPEACIKLCSHELKSSFFSVSTHYREDQISILDILVKSYYAINPNRQNKVLREKCLTIIDEAIEELTLKSSWNASVQLNKLIEIEA
jgi:hypothetical protein